MAPSSRSSSVGAAASAAAPRRHVGLDHGRRAVRVVPPQARRPAGRSASGPRGDRRPGRPSRVRHLARRHGRRAVGHLHRRLLDRGRRAPPTRRGYAVLTGRAARLGVPRARRRRQRLRAAAGRGAPFDERDRPRRRDRPGRRRHPGQHQRAAAPRPDAAGGGRARHPHPPGSAPSDPDTAVLVVGASYAPGPRIAIIDWINDAVARPRPRGRACPSSTRGRELDRPGRPVDLGRPRPPERRGAPADRRPAGAGASCSRPDPRRVGGRGGTGYRLGVPTWEYASVITANDAESQRAGVSVKLPGGALGAAGRATPARCSTGSAPRGGSWSATTPAAPAPGASSSSGSSGSRRPDRQRPPFSRGRRRRTRPPRCARRSRSPRRTPK